MKTINIFLYPFILSVLTFLLTGCGSSAGSLVEEAVSEMEAITDLLNGVENQEDFDDVRDEIQEHVDNIDELGREIDAMEAEMTVEEQKEFEEEYKGKLEVAILEMVAASVKAAMYGFKMPNM